MVSKDDVNSALGNLYRIQGLASPWQGLEGSLQAGQFDEVYAEINRRAGLIKELTSESSFSSQSELWHPLALESRLTAEEYVLPPELEGIHTDLVRDITSGKPLENLAYGGLLLYGPVVGTGKSDYFRFLASQVTGNVHFVVAHLDKINGSPNPGTTLKTLYLELEEKAKEDGSMYVVLFDEFERLVTKHSTLHSAITQESNERHDAKRSSADSRRETRETLELDDVGAQTFAMFKTLISDGEGVQRVYTIATSNQSAYDNALLRRLNPVELKAFGMETFKVDGSRNVPDYSDYGIKLPRVMRILQAAHSRDKKTRNTHLDKFIEELRAKFVSLQENYVVDPSKVKEVTERHSHSTVHTIPAQHAVRNNAYLKTLLTYFGFDAVSAKEKHPERRKEFAFAGQFQEPIYGKREDRIEKEFFSFRDETTPEHTLMINLTPAQVARWYKGNPERFETSESAKAFIGEMIFPQLRVMRDAETAKPQDKKKKGKKKKLE